MMNMFKNLLVVTVFAFTEAKENQACNEKDFAKDFPCSSKSFVNLEGGQRCISIVNKPKATFKTASEFCKNYSKGSLIKLMNETSFAYLTSKNETANKIKHNKYWVDLSICNDGCSGFKRVRGTLKPNRVVDGALPDSAATSTCDIVNSGGQFESVSCIEKNSYICQATDVKPPQPHLIANPHEKPDILIGGSTWEAKCVLFHQQQSDGEIVYFAFRDINGKDVFIWERNDDKVTILKYGLYVRDGGQCVRRTLAALSVQIRDAFNGLRLTCCMRTTTSSSTIQPEICAKDQSFQVKFPPRSPDMQVIYERGSHVTQSSPSLKAFCVGYVGSGGHLSWVFSSPNSNTSIWSISGETGALFNLNESPGMNFTYVLGRDEMYGPKVETSVKLDALHYLPGMVIRCETSLNTTLGVSVEVLNQTRSRRFKNLDEYFNKNAVSSTNPLSTLVIVFCASAFLVFVVVLMGIGFSIWKYPLPSSHHYKKDSMDASSDV